MDSLRTHLRPEVVDLVTRIMLKELSRQFCDGNWPEDKLTRHGRTLLTWYTTLASTFTDRLMTEFMEGLTLPKCVNLI